MVHSQRHSALISATLGLLLIGWSACSPQGPALALEIEIEDQSLGHQEKALVRQNLRALVQQVTGLPVVAQPRPGALALHLLWQRQGQSLAVEISSADGGRRLRNTIPLTDSARLRFEELQALVQQAHAEFSKP